MVNRYGISVMQYNSLVSAIPKDWKKQMSLQQNSGDEKQSLVNKLSLSKRPTQVVYKMMSKTNGNLAGKLMKWGRGIKYGNRPPRFPKVFY